MDLRGGGGGYRGSIERTITAVECSWVIGAEKCLD